MKIFCCLMLLFLPPCLAFNQNNESIVQLAFEDTSNFSITTSLGNRKPPKFYLLDKTNKWDSSMFKLSENIKSDSIRNVITIDEHNPYNNYIFKDTTLDKLFSNQQKNYLYQQSQIVQPRQLQSSNDFTLIKSFKNIDEGFFFSVTDPIFTEDKNFSFIDITVYKKDNKTEKLRDTYFGTIILIYQNIQGKGWVRIYKKEHLIL